MQALKNAVLFILVISISVTLGYFFEPEQPVPVVIAFTLAGLMLFNLAIRNSLTFKSYFTSPLNVFTSKVHSTRTYNIDKELMFEKVKEVIQDSSFRLKGSNKETFELLATTRITFKSWGENMYISFEDDGDQTIMKVISVTFFQMISWGKNQKNCDDLLVAIEDSLTV
jgi:hypothetical protein